MHEKEEKKGVRRFASGMNPHGTTNGRMNGVPGDMASKRCHDMPVFTFAML
jgi:hypothetical protein